jgi:hypothetical protein
MKVLCVGDLYFERVAVIGYVAWGRAGAPARPHLSMANIGKRQFPSDHRQRNSNECQCHFRPEIDRHFILSVSYAVKNSFELSKRPRVLPLTDYARRYTQIQKIARQIKSADLATPVTQEFTGADWAANDFVNALRKIILVKNS